MLTNLTITMTTVSATRNKRTGEMRGKITSSKRSRVKRTGEMRKMGGDEDLWGGSLDTWSMSHRRKSRTTTGDQIKS